MDEGTRKFSMVMLTLVVVVICWAVLAAVLATTIWAAPFLTCDCTPSADAVTGFQLQFGTQTAIDVPAVAPCVTETPCVAPAVRLCYDLGTLPNGPFSVKALAKNAWGSSSWTSPLSDTKQLPTSPSLLKIIK
jgi:hypothetical protein